MKYLLLTFLLFSNFLSLGQADREFWFAVPEVTRSGNLNLDRPIRLIITTASQPANVSVSIPAQLGNIPINISIAANSTTSVDVSNWIDILECKPANQVLNNGLLVSSTSDINVYYSVESGAGGGRAGGDNPEVFTLKGSSALGLDFVIPGQNLLQNDLPRSDPDAQNSFDIIATEDNTIVNITPSNNIVGHLAVNGSFSIQLNKGQTYSATAVSHLANFHLDGSLVASNKPIAITVKDDMLMEGVFSGWCSDLTGDQIVPITKLGLEYIAVSTYLNPPGDQLFISASVNNTSIYLSGSASPIATINRGDTYRVGLNGESLYLRSNFPVAVWQIAGSSCEFGATLLPTIECTGSRRISYIRMPYSNSLKMNLLVKAGSQNDFLVNNQPLINPQFSYVPGTNNVWMYCKYDLPLTIYPLNSIIEIVNTRSEFHLSVTDIAAGGTNYSYYSDYSVQRMIDINMQKIFCVGDSINFRINGLNGTNVRWTGPNNFSSNNPNPIIPNANVSNSGWYYVTDNNSYCGSFDSIYVAVKPYVPLVLKLTDTAFCEFDSITLRAVTTDSILWSLNSPYRLLPANAIKVKLTNCDWIKVSSNDRAKCLLPDSLFVTVDHYPKLNIKASDLVVSCINPYTIITADGAKNYEWYNANRQLINNTDSINYLVNNKEYIYIKGYNNNEQCFTLDSLLLDINVNTINFIPNAFSPNEDGLNDRFGVHLSCDVERYQLSIFNRYGERVFYSVHVEDEWDGTHKGQMCDVGVYYYHLQYRHRLQGGDNMVQRGEIHLLR